METGQVKYYYDVAEQTHKSPFCEEKKNEQNDWQLLDMHK